LELGAAFQAWILVGAQSSLPMRIAATVSRFVVHADEKLTAFVELEAATRHSRGNKILDQKSLFMIP
jgi:hypothetical protein